MTPDEFESVLKNQPSAPVRIHMNNGRVHDVRHPDDAIIGDEVVALGVYEADSERPKIHLLSLININEIEPITTTQR